MIKVKKSISIKFLLLCFSIYLSIAVLIIFFANLLSKTDLIWVAVLTLMLCLFISIGVNLWRKNKILDLQYRYLDVLVNSLDQIVIVTEGTYLSNANKSFFDFLGYESIDKFHEKHDCICEFLEKIEERDYIYRYKGGQNWVKTILANRDIHYKGSIIKDGKRHIFSICATHMDFDELDRSIVIFSDITEIVEHNQELEIKISARTRELNRYINLVDENIIISSTDINGRITYVSEAFIKRSGFSREELMNKSHNIIRHSDTSKRVYEELWATILQGKVWRGELKNKTASNGYYWTDNSIYPNFDLNGNITGYTAIRRDITDRKIVEELLITDALTGLYNRRHFNHMIEVELKRAKTEKIEFAFIIMDIDNFKKYNDNYGHQLGDSALKSVAKIFQNSLSCNRGYPFRLGGEEFGIILNPLNKQDSLESVQYICNEIFKAGIEHKFNNNYGFITASFGLCYIQNVTTDITSDLIYKIADEALYLAKNNGRNRVEIKNL